MKQLKFSRRLLALALALAPLAFTASIEHAQSADDWITQYTGSPLYPSQHGEPGRPGLDPANPKFSDAWGFPERTAYPGSVEHVRVEWQRYIPVAPVYNAKTLLKNWRATTLPGIAKDRIVKYAEPVYYVPKYREIKGNDVTDAFDTGEKNAPVEVVSWKVGDPSFDLDLGTLQAGRPYAVRVIAATPTQNIQRDSLRLVINCEINDGAGGKVNLYRKRVSAIDEFYSVVEFFFWAPETRDYNVKLSLDKSTRLPELLVYNFDLHDQFAQIADRAVKRSASFYDAAERAAVWKSKGIAQPQKVLSPEERAARDREIWDGMPGLNTQVLEGRDMGNMKEWVPYVQDAIRQLAGVTDSKLDFKKVLSIAAAKDDGLGVDFYDTPDAKAHGLHRQTAYPVAWQREDALRGQFQTAIRLAAQYNGTGDAEAGRDAVIYLASVAWKLPTFDSKQTIYLHDISPTFENEDTPFRRRSRDIFYNLRNEWPALSKSYDELFPLIKDNTEIAQAVGRFLPWIKTPADLQRFLDATLLQYRARQIMTYKAWLDDPTPAWMAEIAAVQQDPQVTKPWIDWLFHYVFTYPNKPMGVDELMANNIQRDGTHKVGSWYYAQSGNFSTDIVELLSIYKKFGGTLPYDVADARRFPKAAAMTHFPITSRVAGGYQFQIGDVGGPSEPRFRSWLATEQDKDLIRLGWHLTHDPDFAYIIAHDLGRTLETDEEWAAIQKAAAGRRNPVFEQKSRVLSDWFGVLESGTESDDFRFRRAAGLRVGIGYGHHHDDALDLQIWAQGVPLAADAGQRPGYTQPPSRSIISHNLVVSSLGGHQRGWISSFADAPGARYLEGKTSDNYVRQIALIDADKGKPSAQPLDPKLLEQGKLPTDIVAPNSYVVDVFRVRGGDAPAYAFHGPASDELVTNVADKRAAKPDENAILKQFDDNERDVDATKWIGSTPDTLIATWRMRRDSADYKGLKLQAAEQRALGNNFDPNAPRKYIRMYLPGHGGDSVFGARQVGIKVVNFTFENLYVQPKQWDTKKSQTVFAAVYEPYSGEPYIDSVKLLSPQSALSDFNATIALEVNLKNGRHDVVIVSPGGKMATIAGVTSDGEFGYISRDAQGVRQATLVGGTKLEANGVLLTPARAAYEGEVKAVDYWNKTAELSTPLPSDSAGAVLEIGPPQRRTSYTVTSVKGDETTFLKGMDLAGSRIESFSPDGMPQTATEIAQLGQTVSGDDGVPLWRVGAGSKGNTLQLSGGSAPQSKLKVGDMVRLWEFGPGDKYRLPAWASLTRATDGGYQRAGNVNAPARIGGKAVQ
jgi:hypothetical protein